MFIIDFGNLSINGSSAERNENDQDMILAMLKYFIKLGLKNNNIKNHLINEVKIVVSFEDKLYLSYINEDIFDYIIRKYRERVE